MIAINLEFDSLKKKISKSWKLKTNYMYSNEICIKQEKCTMHNRA